MKSCSMYAFVLLLFWISIENAMSCIYDTDCGLYARCSFTTCVCKYGGTSFSGYTNCDAPSSSYVVVPTVVGLVVFGIIVGVSIGIYCCLRRRRLAQAQQTVIWAQTATPGPGMPVAAQTYPPAYAAQPYPQYASTQAQPPYYNNHGFNANQAPPYNQGLQTQSHQINNQEPNINQEPNKNQVPNSNQVTTFTH